MKISELKTNQGNVEVQGTIKDIGDTRTFTKFGKDLKVANAILSDDSGNIKLTLWNDDVTRFKNGDVIKVNNGYVSEFQGEKQLTSGKFGTIEKITDKINPNEKQKPLDLDSEDEQISGEDY
ncbi:Single-stranded DNA binding protein Ssb [uncultured archaeon]|nr:Single-stranded DNA binding protein Ssb [uncultured archaeon]